MKKILTLALLLSGTTVMAQSTSVGEFRTGATMFSNKSDGCGGGEAAWSNELYFRRKTKSRVAFEAGLNYAKTPAVTIPVTEYDNCGFVGCEYTPLSLTESNQFISANLGLQFDVTCPAMQACPILSRFKNYIGVTISPTLMRTQTATDVITSSDGIARTMHGQLDNYTIWTGISNTLVYNFCCRYYVSSTAQFRLNPMSYFSDFANEELNKAASLQIGVGYKL